ncbi:short-chain dehydrogenase [Tsukamurella pulmonis]|uniref:SDR family NAD(P)-dependent oxidoreductase n=1 Tax=Tsukamurella pulmonis TaxID=47312 RepID=UPI00079278D1|nr:SDR family oxidoreductase [Tsukamurella pulmonis]KXP12075.1 short-chain dehydrogenase [Tsukamurella pulmonis]
MTSIAVVTGAGRGIGLRFAHRLADQGHRVILTDVDGDAAARAAAEVGRDAVGIAQDVRDLDSHRRVAEQAQELGRLAVWVNNAGILIAGDCWTHEDDQLTGILDVNLRGPIGGSIAAVDAMGAQGGAILNVASISALTPVPGLALYAATKAAVLSFTTSLEGDLRHAGLPIRARALCPDVVSTAMVTDRSKDPGAAMLFSGPKPLDADGVAAAGLDLLDSRQVFRVVPRWRGAVVRSADAAPSLGLKILAAMRRIGDLRQRAG